MLPGPLLRFVASSFASASIALGCASSSGIETQKLRDGTFKLKCRGPLTNCLARAEDLCKGRGFDVLGARDQRDRYGPEMGTAQTEVRRSEANIRCGSHKRPLLFGGDEDTPFPGEASEGSFKLPPPPPRAPLAAPPPRPTRACLPGATQACIGPGKCEGGQSCLPDGSGFAPCDCGTVGAPTSVPSSGAAPSSSSAAPLPPLPPAATPKPAPTPPGPQTGTPPPKSGGWPQPAPPPPKPAPPRPTSPY